MFLPFGSFSVGGLTAFIKKGSLSSLKSSGVAVLLLAVVFAQLPSNPAIASVLGLGTIVKYFCV